jgi:Single-strand binding protein family
MRDIATASLSGNLTHDVELRELPSGVDVARLRVARTTRRGRGEEWADKTNCFTVDVYGGQARACAEYLARDRVRSSRPSSTGASGPTSRTAGARRSPCGSRQLLFEFGRTRTDAGEESGEHNGAPLATGEPIDPLVGAVQTARTPPARTTCRLTPGRRCNLWLGAAVECRRSSARVTRASAP